MFTLFYCIERNLYFYCQRGTFAALRRSQADRCHGYDQLAGLALRIAGAAVSAAARGSVLLFPQKTVRDFHAIAGVRGI